MIIFPTVAGNARLIFSVMSALSPWSTEKNEQYCTDYVFPFPLALAKSEGTQSYCGWMLLSA
jgi:hypothetical protein